MSAVHPQHLELFGDDAHLEQERAQLRQLMLERGYREPTGEEQRRQGYKQSIDGLLSMMRGRAV